MDRYHLDRRACLRATGIAIGLPLLDGMSAPNSLGAERSEDPKRIVAMCAPLGIHTPYLFPKNAGTDYEVTPYLEPLQSVRDKFSVISGLMHPMVDGGHSAERVF